MLRILLVSLILNPSLFAGELSVFLKLKDVNKGQTECSLWNKEEGFPKEKTKALRVIKGIKDKEGVVCRFQDVSKGEYAISASQDFNGNGKVDSNWVGIPIEPWGVSNNIRPSLRAPRFVEAKFKFFGTKMKMTIEVLR